jgi:hypothetical protein
MTEGLSIYDSKTLGNKTKCWYCGCEGDMTKDHFWPKSMGGLLKVYCCQKDNRAKGNKLPKEWIQFINSKLIIEDNPDEIIRLRRMKRATSTLWNKVKDSIYQNF